MKSYLFIRILLNVILITGYDSFKTVLRSSDQPETFISNEIEHTSGLDERSSGQVTGKKWS